MGGLLQGFGQVQIAGKVVGGPRGQIAQHRPGVQSQQTGDGLAEGAVSAAADDPVKPAAQLGGDTGGVRLALGGIGSHQISGLGKGVQQPRKVPADSSLARMRVENKQQLFHKDLLCKDVFCSYIIPSFGEKANSCNPEDISI